MAGGGVKEVRSPESGVRRSQGVTLTSPVSSLFLLLAILVVGGMFRFTGLSFGLPFVDITHPDEAFYPREVQNFERTQSLEPLMFAYGGMAFYPLHAAAKFVPAQSNVELARLQRRLSAAFGTATLLLTFLLGRAVRSTAAGLAAAAVLAVTFVHVRDSHYGVADVQLAFVVTWAFLALVRAGDSGRPLHFALAGALVGLAAAIKYTPAVLAVPIAVIAFGAAGRDRGRALRCIGAAALAMIGAFLLGAPYTLLAWDRFAADFAWQLTRTLSYSGVSSGPQYHGPLYHLQNSLGLGIGWPLTLLAALGVVAAFVPGRRGARTLALAVLVYFAAVSFGQFTFVRYVLPIVPAVLVLAVDGVFRIVAPAQSRPRAALAAAILVLAATPTLWRSVVLVRLMERETTLQQFLAWCERNIPAGTTFATTHHDYSVPLRARQLAMVGWDPVALRRGSAEYLFVFEHPKPDFDAPRGHDLVRDAAFEREPVARFRAVQPTDYLDTDSFYPYPLRDLERFDRIGPDITVYRRRTQQEAPQSDDVFPVPTQAPRDLEVELKGLAPPALHWELPADPAAAGLRVRIVPRESPERGTVFFLPAHADELDTTGIPAGAYDAWIRVVGLAAPGPEAGPLAFEVPGEEEDRSP
jgi:hypothetical protein